MTAELPWDWTAEETARMGAFAARVAEAFPGREVVQFRVTFDTVTGALLTREEWRWGLGLEWDDGGRAHARWFEAETLDQMETRLEHWITEVRLQALQSSAVDHGLDGLSDDDIDAEIRAVRDEPPVSD